MAPTTRNTGRALLEPDSNQSQEVNMNAAAVVQPLNEPGSRKKVKRARGPTFMCKVWGQHDNERVQVLFNDKGQPISNYSILSHFLGTIARNGKYAPLQYKTWHKMPRVFKEDMFALVLQKFDFSPGHKRWILKSLSKKWRNWKATVKRDHYDSDLPIEEQIHSPPDRVQADQWKELVKYWHEDAKAKNLGHDPSRAHMFLTCFTNDGKVSNEELRKKIEKMKELSEQVPEGELDSSGPNDVFSKAMGKEKSGSVRMYGLGVCPSDVWGDVPSSGTSYRMSMEWKTELDKTNQKLEELANLYLQSQANGANSSNTRVTSPNIPVTSPNQHIGSSTSTTQRGRVKVVRDDDDGFVE
ncbi:hypothetical protein RHGRI_010547 [Rhododendron griersonianum]|uniref:Transposase n=1 Tax=Rhododendron griersonianum TaxID=479676 RepID=A0AAV6KJH7_9ERIC|nr:hypothetical protein RHGRI_010547 [Rhododendron griersonianum]